MHHVRRRAVNCSAAQLDQAPLRITISIIISIVIVIILSGFLLRCACGLEHCDVFLGLGHDENATRGKRDRTKKGHDEPQNLSQHLSKFVQKVIQNLSKLVLVAFLGGS